MSNCNYQVALVLLPTTVTPHVRLLITFVAWRWNGDWRPYQASTPVAPWSRFRGSNFICDLNVYASEQKYFLKTHESRRNNINSHEKVYNSRTVHKCFLNSCPKTFWLFWRLNSRLVSRESCSYTVNGERCTTYDGLLPTYRYVRRLVQVPGTVVLYQQQMPSYQVGYWQYIISYLVPG